MNSVMLLQLAVCGFVVRCAPATTRFESIWHGGKNGCSNPCENIGANICSMQGVCVPDGCGWNCRCYAGYTGKFCEERVFSAAPVSSTNKKTYDPIVNGNILDMLDQTLRDSTTSSSTASTTPAETTMVNTSTSTSATSQSIAITTSAKALTPEMSKSMTSTSITIKSPITATSTQSSTPLRTSLLSSTTALPRSSLLLVPLSILGVFNWKSAAVTHSLTGQMNTIEPSRVAKTSSLKTTADTHTLLEIPPTKTVPKSILIDTTRNSSSNLPTISSKQDQITSKSAEIPQKRYDQNNTKPSIASPKRHEKIVLGAMPPRSVDITIPIDSVPTIEHLLEIEPQSIVPTSHGGSPRQSIGTEVLTHVPVTEVGQNGTSPDSVTHDQTQAPSSVETNDQTQAPSSVETNDDETNTNIVDTHTNNDNGNGFNGVVDANQNISGEETTLVGQNDFSSSTVNEEKGQMSNNSNGSSLDVSVNTEPGVNKSEKSNADNGNNENNGTIDGQNTVEMNTSQHNGTSGNYGTNDNADKRGTSDNGTGGKNGITDLNYQPISVETTNNGDPQNGDNGNGNTGVDKRANNKGTPIINSGSDCHNSTENQVQKDNTGKDTGRGGGLNSSVDSNGSGDNSNIIIENKHTNGHQRLDNGLGKTVHGSNTSNSGSGVKDVNTHSVSSQLGGTSHSENGRRETSITSPTLDNGAGTGNSSGYKTSNGGPRSHRDRITVVERGGSKRVVWDPVEPQTSSSRIVEGSSYSIRGVESSGSGSSSGRKEQTADSNSGQKTLKQLQNGSGHSITENGGD